MEGTTTGTALYVTANSDQTVDTVKVTILEKTADFTAAAKNLLDTSATLKI